MLCCLLRSRHIDVARAKSCTCDQIGIEDGVELPVRCTQVLCSLESSWQVAGCDACCDNHVIRASICELGRQELDIVQGML